MSSVSKSSKSKSWQANFRDNDNKRFNKTTGVPSTAQLRNLAETVAEFWESIAKKENSRKSLEDRSQMLIEKLTSKLSVEEETQVIIKFKEKTRTLLDKSFPSKDIPSFKVVSARWLKLKKEFVKETSFVSYSQCVDDFISFLGDNADVSLQDFDREWLRDFQSLESQRISNKTANKKVKRVCSVLRWAYKEDIIEINHADKIQHLPTKTIQHRRPFSTAELKRIIAAADKEWKSMIHAGYGTGQRLGDIATMRWEDIDLATRVWTFATTKTEKVMTLPLLSDFAELLEETPKKNRVGYVHPVAAERFFKNGKKSGTLSNQFSDLLFKAGLIESKAARRSQGKGRNAKRAPIALGFHCLRYTTATLLHENGAPQSIAQEIIGHSSEAVHRIYVKPRLEPIRHELEKLSFNLSQKVAT